MISDAIPQRHKISCVDGQSSKDSLKQPAQFGVQKCCRCTWYSLGGGLCDWLSFAGLKLHLPAFNPLLEAIEGGLVVGSDVAALADSHGGVHRDKRECPQGAPVLRIFPSVTNGAINFGDYVVSKAAQGLVSHSWG